MEFEEQLINQLVVNESSMDQACCVVFKTIIEAQRENEFLKALNKYSHEKDDEIEKLCHEQYGNFVDSLDGILELNKDLTKIKEKTTELKREIGKAGQLIYDSRVELFETNKLLFITNATIKAIEDCLEALNIAQQATLQLIDENFGLALQLLKKLESQYLPKIDQFSTCKMLKEWIPKQRKFIKTFATNQIKLWLANVRDQSQIIGEIAFLWANERLDGWRALPFDDIEAYFDLVDLEREHAGLVIDNERCKVDFEPLLRAVYIYYLMDSRPEFSKYFAEYRLVIEIFIFSNLFDSLGTGKSDLWNEFRWD